MRACSGVDKGAGVKFLMLPPGYKDKVPDGYIALQPDTFGSYVLFRSNLTSHGDADVAKSIAYGKRIKVYPLSQASNPPPTVFTDVKDVAVRLHHPLRRELLRATSTGSCRANRGSIATGR